MRSEIINNFKQTNLSWCLSKLSMYEVYYNNIDKLWSNTKIIGFDTNSMRLSIYTDDVYEDMKKYKTILILLNI